MDIIELYSKIEEKRKELNNLVSSRISDLSTSEIIKINNELDELIAAYFELFGLQINQEPVE